MFAESARFAKTPMVPRVWSSLWPDLVQGDLICWRHFSSNAINSASTKKVDRLMQAS